MKKSLVIIIVLLISSFFWGGCDFLKKAPEKIALIPLDSRPCNTQYPELLGLMANKSLDIPYEYLDNYLGPAQTENLWLWLEDDNKRFKKIIINTNELFNGGLIASRHPDSYADLDKNLARLKAFCEKSKKTNIVVITILPRLLPSQFTNLWQYQDPLIKYAQEIDQADLEGSKPPKPSQKIPKGILEDYLSVYKNSQVIVDAIMDLAAEGLIDHYLIGQDDGEKYGLSNKLVRELSPYLGENVHFVQGADELTMLALTRNLPFRDKVALNISYTNKEYKEVFFPFEAASLEQVVQTKLSYLNILLNEHSGKKIIIHNDPEKVSLLEEMVQENTDPYLGLMDIAYTNKGDIPLLDLFLQGDTVTKITGYSGWNTASNTVGTELAHVLSYHYLEKNFKKYKKPAQADAVRAYVEFKYLRVAEDIIYQGILREQLNEHLIQLNIDPSNLGSNHEQANEILAELFAPYQEKLTQAFIGEYKIGEKVFKIDNISAHIELPWSRTFEAKITPVATVQ